MFIRKILAAISYKIAYYKWRNKVTLLHKDVSFYRSTRITLSEGADKSNIEIDFKSRIHGTLSACSKGKIYFGKYSQLGPGSVVRSVNSVRIGDYSAIAPHVIISDNNSHPVNPYDRLILRKTPMGSKLRSWIYSDNAPIIIGKNCWIGENSRICKGVVIGDGAVVAANAVVTKDVPSNSIAAGNPARIVRTDIDINVKRVFSEDIDRL